jgi:hypothetical protein
VRIDPSKDRLASLRVHRLNINREKRHHDQAMSNEFWQTLTTSISENPLLRDKFLY